MNGYKTIWKFKWHDMDCDYAECLLDTTSEKTDEQFETDLSESIKEANKKLEHAILSEVVEEVMKIMESKGYEEVSICPSNYCVKDDCPKSNSGYLEKYETKRRKIGE